MVLQPEWQGHLMARCSDRFLRRFLARWILAATAHEADGQELAQLGHRAQESDPRIEMRAGTEVDEFLLVFRPLRDRHEAWNPEIAGDVEHPQPATGFGKLDF